MQVLIAYGLDNPEGGVSERLERVADHYGELWLDPVTRRGRDVGRVGLHVWDANASLCRWPVWQEDQDFAIATAYHPIGYERVVGQIPAERAALPLGRTLRGRPDLAAELSPPFVIGMLEQEAGRVTLVTDAIGLGRLYELRFPGGWVWSNRPAAAFRFAGVRAEADPAGWRMFAATAAFMGEYTPFERLYMVPGATQVGYETGGRGRVERCVDTLAAWATNRRGDPLAADRVDELAEALQERVRSLTRIWSCDIVADLSGGRDSRLVVAALLSAGVDIRIQTDGVLAGEAAVAELLVAELPIRVEHSVLRPGMAGEPDSRDTGMTTLERALGWHRCEEGLRPATYLPKSPPMGLPNVDHVQVGGAAGEIAHGYYYPPDLAKFAALPYAERFRRLEIQLAKRLIRRDVSAKAQEESEWQMRRVLRAAARVGLEDARVLDYFYAAERLRHWGTTAGANGRVSPLLSPEFVRAAFDLAPEQRRENALHRAVTTRLMPAWADVPYYERAATEIPNALRPRLGSASDRDLIAAIVDDSQVWGDAYDPAVVQRYWQSLQTGEPSPAAERMIQRVIWRAVFTDYLAELNGEELPVRAASQKGRGLSIRSGPLLRGRLFTGRALRKVARVVEPV